ncbi:MAG: helix-turn-helix transcriptional regulator [Chlamydiales bacterium]|nr:helix-turn-helix transcriptional regulator [Chlamydiales bacterium]
MPLFLTPHEASLLLAERVKELRLAQNLSQKTLADRSGVSYGTIKRFEQTGKISLVLGVLEDFNALFLSKQKPQSIQELLKSEKRKRGRK